MPDREKVIKGLTLVREDLWYQAEQNKQYKHYYVELDGSVNDAIALLKELKSVMCKDCKHWRKLMLNPDGQGQCRSGKTTEGRVTEPEWFCADGERKGDCK